MRDKISDETLQLIANDYLDACSLIDISALMAKELLARRAAEVKSVVIPSTTCIGWVKEAIHEHDEHWIMAIKAAGGTVKE